MALGEECLHLVLSKGLIGDGPTQAKVIVANHAFNLLCSAAEDSLVGRYGAASNHWRSLVESPRFLMALQLNPSLSQKMIRGQLKIEAALETIRNEYSEEKYPGADLGWVKNMEGEIGRIQPFSHVHLRTASAGFPISEEAGGKIYRVTPGGAISKDALPDNIMFLADIAISLVVTMFFAFSGSDSDVDALGKRRGLETLRDLKAKLLQLARGRGVSI